MDGWIGGLGRWGMKTWHLLRCDCQGNVSLFPFFCVSIFVSYLDGWLSGKGGGGGVSRTTTGIGREGKGAGDMSEKMRRSGEGMRLLRWGLVPCLGQDECMHIEQRVWLEWIGLEGSRWPSVVHWLETTCA
jgi:hypothetical protein